MTYNRTPQRSWLSGLLAALGLYALLFSGLAVAIVAGIIVALPLVDVSSGVANPAPSGWVALLVIMGSGVAAMISIEIVRRLVPIRGIYQRRAVSRLLGGAVTSGSPYGLRAELAWYDVPLEQLIAQMGGIAEKELLALEADSGSSDTRQVPALLGALTKMEEMQLTTSMPVPAPTLPSQYSIRRRRDEPMTMEYREVPGDEAEVRARLEAALDELQIVIGARWRRCLRLSGCLLAACITYIAIAVAYYPQGDGAALLPFLPSAFILGGFISWLARDLVAAVERWRR
ncbi:hypothetical protein ACU610_00690 [Geodermatophilus sp. URMC 61]|uniref:hypothetical protein n=1 Tax=Geodermatophilus sp. URMC 61 TaxID=3423411 RepID=UPI00406C7839